MITQSKPRRQIARQSLTSALADQLRDKILRGEYREGEQLRQHAIAAEFEVSTIPVREAFRQLEAEGLISIIDHRGAVVSALLPDEVEEIFEIRAALECLTLRYAIPLSTEEDFARAEEILKAYEVALGDKSDMETWGQLHWQFHTMLYAAAHRSRSMSFIQTINHHADRYIRLHILYSRELHRNGRDEHRALLELCRQREVDQACQLLERHITKAGRELKEYIERQRELS